MGSQTLHRLKALPISRPLKRGYYADGGGLYLQVGASGAKSWVFRYRSDGRLREQGLGSTKSISLADARTLAADARKLVANGQDPISFRRDNKAAARREAARSVTFKECTEAYIASNSSAWRNPKHRQQWSNTLASYADQVFGNVSVKDVDTNLIIRALDPIWTAKPETASRVRGRIETVLDWATVREYRSGANPARWKGHLDKILPAHRKFVVVKHHAAIPYAELPTFIRDLRKQDGVASLALEFTILTAARTGEVIGATWPEIDLENSMWTIPADRMKSHREHRVPLALEVLSVLHRVRKIGDADYLFPTTANPAKPISNMAMLALLRRMERTEITTHGFRSTFRDWAAEKTDFPNEVVEMAIAHTVSNKVEAAYRRGDLLEKRRRLMAEWAQYCGRELLQLSKETEKAA